MSGDGLSLLRCPTCIGALAAAAEGAEILCPGGHRYPVREPGYIDVSIGQAPDDVTARTAESFGYKWTTFDRVEPEDETYWRWYFTDVPLDDLAGRAALDAGCGKGCLTRFTALHLGPLVALDASEAVSAAANNLGDLPNVTVVQADLTVRLPQRVLRYLAARLAAVLYGAFVVPGAIRKRRGVRRLVALPLSVYRGKPLRALRLDTFDRLSAPVEHRYTWSQLEPWFDRAGLEVLAAREDVGWFVAARQPDADGLPALNPHGAALASPQP